MLPSPADLRRFSKTQLIPSDVYNQLHNFLLLRVLVLVSVFVVDQEPRVLGPMYLEPKRLDLERHELLCLIKLLVLAQEHVRERRPKVRAVKRELGRRPIDIGALGAVHLDRVAPHVQRLPHRDHLCSLA